MIQYRIYRNDGAGGPIDFTTPLTMTPSLTYQTTPLAPGDWSFVVRAVDDQTNLEDQGVTSRVRLIVGPTGQNLTGRPLAPPSFVARFRSPSQILVRWYGLDRTPPYPTSFGIWISSTGSVDFTTSPTRTVPAAQGIGHYSVLVPAPGAGPWTVGLAAINAVGQDGQNLTATVAAVAIPPAVDNLTGS